MASPKLLEKLNAGFKDLPISAGPKVFFASEYQEAIGLQRAETTRRLRSLLSQGKIRKVRARRDGRVLPAYEYVG
jgi:hypothetical protein